MPLLFLSLFFCYYGLSVIFCSLHYRLNTSFQRELQIYEIKFPVPIEDSEVTVTIEIKVNCVKHKNASLYWKCLFIATVNAFLFYLYQLFYGLFQTVMFKQMLSITL